MAEAAPGRTLPMLDVERLAVRSGSRTVIRDLSFRAHAGTLLWLTGENGIGKSALLRVLALRAPAFGAIRFQPCASFAEIAFYSPHMGVPPHMSVRGWQSFSERLAKGGAPQLGADDPLRPRVDPASRMTRLSTGEAKRLLLWTLLRLARPYTLLDEPYEHLSPAAKSRLTEILAERAAHGVVVVATNQDVPLIANKRVMHIGNP